MRKNLILLFVLVVVGGAAYYLIKNKSSNTTLSDKPLAQFALEDTSAVTRISIFDPVTNKTSVLERTDSSTLWVVNQKWYARQDVMQMLLRTMKNLKVRSDVPVKARNNVMRDLIVARRVEVYQGKDEPSMIYFVGHSTPDKLGTFMLLEKPGVGRSEVPYIVHLEGNTGFLTPRFFADENEWRYTGIFNYPDLAVKSIELVDRTPDMSSFRISYGGGNDISIARDPQGLGTYNEPVQSFDTLSVKDYMLLYKRVHVETYMHYLSDAAADSLLKTVPAYTIRVADNGGAVKSVDLYLRKALNPMPGPDGNPYPWDQEYFYARTPSGELALAQRYVFDPLVNFGKGSQ